MSAIGFGLIALMGGSWLSDQVAGMKIGGLQPIYVRAAGFLLVIIIAAILIYYFIGKKKKTVDFMVATEGEMKKVNWSTRKEILGMTWVVIGLTVFIAALLFVFDYFFFGPFFRFIDVVETTT